MQKLSVTVTVSMPEELHLTLPEDQAVLLFQSVRELLINTSKYAGTGAATVTVECRDDQLRIQVRDEGSRLRRGCRDGCCVAIDRWSVIQIRPAQYPGADAGIGRIVRHSICPGAGRHRDADPAAESKRDKTCRLTGLARELAGVKNFQRPCLSCNLVSSDLFPSS